MTRLTRAAGIFALLAFGGAGAAWADVVGMPFGEMKGGEVRIQGAYSTSERPLSAQSGHSTNYTINEAVVSAGVALNEWRLVGVQYGPMEIHTAGLGTMTGAGTGAFFQESERGSRNTKKYVSFRYQTAKAENSLAALNLTLWDAMLGVTVKTSGSLNYRVAALFSLIWGDLTAGAPYPTSTTVTSQAFFGVLGGLDYSLASWLVLGAEARLLTETSLAATLTARF